MKVTYRVHNCASHDISLGPCWDLGLWRCEDRQMDGSVWFGTWHLVSVHGIVGAVIICIMSLSRTEV